MQFRRSCWSYFSPHTRTEDTTVTLSLSFSTLHPFMCAFCILTRFFTQQKNEVYIAFFCTLISCSLLHTFACPLFDSENRFRILIQFIVMQQYFCGWHNTIFCVADTLNPNPFRLYGVQWWTEKANGIGQSARQRSEDSKANYANACYCRNGFENWPKKKRTNTILTNIYTHKANQSDTDIDPFFKAVNIVDEAERWKTAWKYHLNKVNGMKKKENFNENKLYWCQ